MAIGVTSTGFVRETEEEIRERMVTAVRSTISPSLDTSENSIIGRLISIFAAEKAEDHEILEAVYNALNESASGQSLDNLSALTGTTREDATFSTVTCTVNMDNGTAVTAGQIVASVDGNPDALFENVAAFTAPSTGNHSLEFIAQTSGPVQAPSGTLTVLEVTITGVNSITNTLDADPGEAQENDAALRVRRRQLLTAQGTGTLDAILADVRSVDAVESAQILENRTQVADADGLAPHSFEIVVLGGADNDLAQAIWDSMPAGIGNQGTSSGTAVDDGGNNQTVNFSRPTETRVYVDVTLTTNPTTYAGDDEVKAAIAEFTNGSLEIELPDGTYLNGELGVGRDLVLSRLYSAIFTVSGVTDVTLIEADTTASPTSTSNISIGSREVIAVGGSVGIQTGDIGVTSS